MKKLFSSVIVSAVLAGCASVPMGDAKQDAALKEFKTLSPDKAAIYVYRNETMGAAAKMDVQVDGQAIGQTVAHTYLYTEVAPGKHTVTSKAENTDTIELDVKPGTLAYVWQEVKMGVLSARSKLHLVSEPEGKKGVQESKLAVK